MATQADIDRLRQALEGAEGVDGLEDLLLDCEGLLKSLSRSIDRTGEEDVRQHLRGLKAGAEELRVDIKKKLLEARADRVDPQFARRQAEKWEDESRRFAEQMSELTGPVGEGVAALIRGIAEVVRPYIHPEPGATCPKCGGELLAGAKFCPECGAPVPREAECASCGAKLAASFKFCPECGAKRV